MRLDHFRALAGFWAVPGADSTAENVKLEKYAFVRRAFENFPRYKHTTGGFGLPPAPLGPLPGVKATRIWTILAWIQHLWAIWDGVREHALLLGRTEVSWHAKETMFWVAPSVSKPVSAHLRPPNQPTTWRPGSPWCAQAAGRAPAPRPKLPKDAGSKPKWSRSAWLSRRRWAERGLSRPG